MNLSKPLRAASLFLHSLVLRCRVHLPRKQCFAFVPPTDAHEVGISQIYVINLDRQPGRWTDVLRELACILDASGTPLADRASRFSASDAQTPPDDLEGLTDIDPHYSLGDQLFVEPQPNALPDEFDLVRPIRMSQAEVAIAHSHIRAWRTIAQSAAPYALVLEDDVWFARDFSRVLDQAWREMKEADGSSPDFDVLYVSYAEARHGGPKELLSKNVFRPERGLWFLSGYVLSRKGAQALLRLLPCRGPIDLWINHKFDAIDVRALRRPVVNQRADLLSTNSYSVLPALSTIGVLDYSNTALFHQRPSHYPVFAFGPPDSGLSSLAMALSMLGYRCCSDLDQIPELELGRLIAGRAPPIFNAYVNVGSLRLHLRALMLRYPKAKFIVTECEEAINHCDDSVTEALAGADLVHLNPREANPWRTLCEHLRLPPPAAPYPVVQEIGQRKVRGSAIDPPTPYRAKQLRHDRSPWIVEPHAGWEGISGSVLGQPGPGVSLVNFEDDLADVQLARWMLRNDTFPGNLGLFRPANVSTQSGGGLALTVRQEPLGVRNFSAAAISSQDSFLYGRFEATLQATSVSGLVTGFFLYRASPRQEIDIEITGNRPTRLLVNVFYNPGSEGAKFDYGYRGTPVAIPLGFDASKAPHRFAIEWDPSEIRWFVDGNQVYRRTMWNPTPIPHLPMKLHANTWPTRSRNLAGRLSVSALPGSAFVRYISVKASKAGA
ncbi:MULTISPECIES: family 16 glycosylhydrolase [Bradyrhizobium]|uniref:family 16 glycosylhydrolase n=1 Tax=Bradyrhizobium TaxID=374 RepID=UPI0004B84241|nr:MULTISPECIES: family 16 glycosylhydrolase [Bradyrhizobium]